ncbi:MAG TPA: Holliday junction branch migration protein RuvA [Candidatus Baltobacteraceae bacterium]|jgi:Holliday junction DNA helicase RuvA|nr:Holliday junction branch migration protein RuvA [Candidatus Baltobacteraceae bacterium]
MFSRIRGTLVERGEGSVILDVHGLSYEIILPPCVSEKVAAPPGAEVTLEIHAVLNIEGNTGHYTFYGFSNAIEREFFEALISVASIGPRSAARAFSQPMSRIAGAIDRGDHGFLKTLPGIGQQKARDIVAKLQGKVAKFLLIQEAQTLQGAASHAQPLGPDFAEEALAVLLQLEYKRAEAEEMIRSTLDAAPDIRDAETLLGEIYKQKAMALR